MEIDGRGYGKLSATRNDELARAVRARMAALGHLTRMAGISHHIEMKVAAIMATSDNKRGRVIINHAPCGSEPDEFRGCDQYLPNFLQEGSSLTVLGTDARGNPFRRTYCGKARG